MNDDGYQKAEKIYPTDKMLQKLILWAFPCRIRPNHITVLRFILTPVVVGLLWQERYDIGFVAFLLVSLSDAIDGALARTRDQITRWGMLYDPVADKLLIGATLYVLVFKFLVWHIAAIIIILDVTIITWAFFQKRRGVHLQANIWGKCKMITQVTGVCLILLGVVASFDPFVVASTFVFYLAIGFALASMATNTI